MLPADPGRLPHGIDHHKALAIPDGRSTHAVVAIRECGHSLLLQPVCPLRPSPAQEFPPAPLPPNPIQFRSLLRLASVHCNSLSYSYYLPLLSPVTQTRPPPSILPVFQQTNPFHNVHVPCRFHPRDRLRRFRRPRYVSPYDAVALELITDPNRWIVSAVPPLTRFMLDALPDMSETGANPNVAVSGADASTASVSTNSDVPVAAENSPVQVDAASGADPSAANLAASSAAPVPVCPL